MSTSPARRARRKGMLGPKRNFTPEEALQFQEINRLINARKFELDQIRGNTALIPNGQEYVKTLEGVVAVLDDVGRRWISQKLEQCGYMNGTRCSVNLNTGEITLEK